MPKKRNFLGGMQKYNPKTGEYESRLTKADGQPATKENMPGGEDEKSKAFKKFGKDKKPTDYKGVEKTPYGYIYNVNGKSITDLKEERKAIGMKVDDSKNYGFSVFKGGEEVFYDTFEEAYNSVNKTKPNNKQMDYKELGEYIKEEGLDTETYDGFDDGTTEDDNTEVVSKAEKALGVSVLDSKENLEDAKQWLVSKGYAKSHLEAQDLIESTLSDEGKDKLNKLLGFDETTPIDIDKIAMDLGEYISEDSMSAIKRYAKHYDVDVDTIKDVIAEKIKSGELTSENEERIVDDILEDVVTGKINIKR